MLGKIRHIHFVGVGGSGMSGIAELLLNQGYKVSGSDLKFSPVTDRLQQLGARVFEGHRAEHVAGADVVVVSTAVRADNPEVQYARRHQIPVIPRAEMLAELMRLKYSIAVAGAHGKTTTTSMIGTVLAHAGLDPTIIVGGRLHALGSGARLGSGQYLVAEADESDKSFLKLTPTFAVVTNIDREHLDVYRDLDEIRDCFVQFVNKVPFYGLVVLCLDDPGAQAIIPRIERRIITYGLSSQADVEATDVELSPQLSSQFVVKHRGQALGPIHLRVPGGHNIYNALAAVAVGLDLEIDFPSIAAGLAQFSGVARRFEFKGQIAGVQLYDDYGHHPTEIKATLSAAKSAGHRLVVLFQPHRYTRTKYLMDEFAVAFNDADLLLVTDIYPASEDPIEGVTAAALVERIKQFGHKQADYVGELEHAVERLASVVRPGDMVLTLGAGNVYRAGEQLMEHLKERRGT
ncbi:MAG: UDP-N-acetylmuramate--L-alanine ligase [Blastocatellia bacterium]|nr:UDP-N-acetylmuramate--L-alanine ligase [Blastocatellia bacterium]